MLKSVKNTDTAEKKGYDAGEKISGIKRHIAVDTNVAGYGKIAKENYIQA